MPHPFFDTIAYPWKRDDAIKLHVALYSAISADNQITLLYGQSGGTLPRSPGLAAHLAWAEVINLLTAGRNLQTLCGLVLAEPAWKAAHEFVRAVQAAVHATQVTLLTTGQVFLDRKPLRAELEKLTADGLTAPRVLLVRGPSGSGKSWTWELIADVAKNLGGEVVYLIPGIVSTVDEVVENLFSAMGDMDAIPKKDETDDAWFRKVCNKLQELAQKKKVVTWVVADDLGDYPEGPRLDPMIRRFFNQFGIHTLTPAFGNWFRLVLLDYPDVAVPSLWKNGWVEDRPSETHVDEAPLKEYLLQWAARANKQLGEEKAAQFASDIIQKVSVPVAAGHSAQARLKRINDEVNVVLKNL